MSTQARRQAKASKRVIPQPAESAVKLRAVEPEAVSKSDTAWRIRNAADNAEGAIKLVEGLMLEIQQSEALDSIDYKRLAADLREIWALSTLARDELTGQIVTKRGAA